jgi:maleate isomerase
MRPVARLGVILSSSNRCVEPYFQAHAPEGLSLHYTRMRMAAGLRGGAREVADTAIASAQLLADAKLDVIDLQATGIIMAAGPEAEAELVGAITQATGIPAYTATQAIVEALRALDVEALTLITPFDVDANASERSYLEAQGFAIVGAAGLGTLGGIQTAAIPPEKWVEAATANDTSETGGFVLSGSNTTMVDAITTIEAATDKPVVTSIQAALWAGLARLGDKLSAAAASPALGQLFNLH